MLLSINKQTCDFPLECESQRLLHFLFSSSFSGYYCRSSLFRVAYTDIFGCDGFHRNWCEKKKMQKKFHCDFGWWIEWKNDENAYEKSEREKEIRPNQTATDRHTEISYNKNKNRCLQIDKRKRWRKNNEKLFCLRYAWCLPNKFYANLIVWNIQLCIARVRVLTDHLQTKIWNEAIFWHFSRRRLPANWKSSEIIFFCRWRYMHRHNIND